MTVSNKINTSSDCALRNSRLYKIIKGCVKLLRFFRKLKSIIIHILISEGNVSAMDIYIYITSNEYFMQEYYSKPNKNFIQWHLFLVLTHILKHKNKIL